MRFHIYVWLLKIFVFSCAYFSCIPNSCLGCYVWFWKTCANNAICFETPYRCICRAIGTLWKSKKEFYPNFYEDRVKNWKLCFGLWQNFIYDLLLKTNILRTHVIISSKIGAIHRGGVIKASYASKWWKQNFWCDKSSDGPDYNNMQNGLTPKDFFLNLDVLRLNHIQRLVVEL